MYLAFPTRTELFHPRRLARTVLDILLPPACVTCGDTVDTPSLQCGACFGALSAPGEPCCVCCGVPFELPSQAIEGGWCQRCLDTPPPFQRARAALNYDKASRRLVLPFKHGDRTEYAALLARKMAQAGRVLLTDADVLVPVPLHRRRLFVRRYNQAALLADALGRLSGRTAILDALIRARTTESLGGKSASERRDEVAGAISLRPGREAAIAGRRVLVIDDVMTSGATAGACAEALLAAGARDVDVLVAVRVPDPRLERPYRTRKHGARRRTPGVKDANP